MGGGDLDLLRKEMDLLWGADLYGRPHRSLPLVAVGLASGGHDVRFGPAFFPGDHLSATEDGVAPPALRRRFDELRAQRPVRLDGGPSYVLKGGTPSASPHRIVTSEDRAALALQGSRPERWGDPQEWVDLLAGRLGPWAVGLAGERIASICYTPVASPTSAEAGIWTHPDERGRGWATPVVAAWAHVAAGCFETLFYSTGFSNAASQSIARKLGARRIGTIWQILDIVP